MRVFGVAVARQTSSLSDGRDHVVSWLAPRETDIKIRCALVAIGPTNEANASRRTFPRSYLHTVALHFTRHAPAKSLRRVAFRLTQGTRIGVCTAVPSRG